MFMIDFLFLEVYEELEKVTSCIDSILIGLFRTPSFLYNYKEEEAVFANTFLFSTKPFNEEWV